VGSGSGEVAFLAADLVGATGEVVGADRAAAAVQRATARPQARDLRNVKFLEGDPAEMRFDRPFDAVIGRLILMYYLEKLQIATATEVDIATLAQRLRDEVVAAKGVVLSPGLIEAWSRNLP
jgi:SAM-dependent methyltransferase